MMGTLFKTNPSKYKLPRSYYVLVNGKLTSEQQKQIETGIKLKDGMIYQLSLQRFTGKTSEKAMVLGIRLLFMRVEIGL